MLFIGGITSTFTDRKAVYSLRLAFFNCVNLQGCMQPTYSQHWVLPHCLLKHLLCSDTSDFITDPEGRSHRSAFRLCNHRVSYNKAPRTVWRSRVMTGPGPLPPVPHFSSEGVSPVTRGKVTLRFCAASGPLCLHLVLPSQKHLRPGLLRPAPSNPHSRRLAHTGTLCPPS